MTADVDSIMVTQTSQHGQRSEGRMSLTLRLATSGISEARARSVWKPDSEREPMPPANTESAENEGGLTRTLGKCILPWS